MSEVVIFPYQSRRQPPNLRKLFSANIAGVLTEDGTSVRIIKNRYAPHGEIIPIDEFMIKYFTDMI